MDEETEAQSNSVACLRSHTQEVAGPGLETSCVSLDLTTGTLYTSESGRLGSNLSPTFRSCETLSKVLNF